MRLALVVFITLIGVSITLVAAIRMWRANKRGAPTQLVLGYAGIMVLASLCSLLMLRLL